MNVKINIFISIHNINKNRTSRLIFVFFHISATPMDERIFLHKFISDNKLGGRLGKLGRLAHHFMPGGKLESTKIDHMSDDWICYAKVGDERLDTRNMVLVLEDEDDGKQYKHLKEVLAKFGLEEEEI